MKKVLLHIFFLLLSTGSFAQFNSQGAFPYIDIRTFMSFKVEVVGNDLEYTFSGADDYANGITKSSVFKVSIKSNKNWRVFVSSISPLFTPLTSGSSNNLPVSVLGFRKSNTANFQNLQVTFTEVSNGNRGGWGRPGNIFFLDLKADPGANYDGGSYVVDVVFTLTAD